MLLTILIKNGKPVLLQKNKLIKPIEQALDRIEKIRERKISNDDSIILEGLFILGVSSFENSLIDTLRILLINIPNKLDIKTESITKDELIKGNPLERAIENKLNDVSYKNISEIINYFLEKTTIPQNSIQKDEIDNLIEIKATRNLLIHNNLIINSIYKDTAGVNIRLGNCNKLEINQDYLLQSIITLKNILQGLKNALLIKYVNFTKLKATEELFKYIFPTPIMHFKNEFETDIKNDTIGKYKVDTSRKNNLSSSENFLYDIWLSHSHRIGFSFDYQNFYTLDNNNKEKFGYLISQIDILKS